MKKDLTEKIKIIKSNNIANEIIIEDILIENDIDIDKALEKCIHDKYSDIDIKIKIKDNISFRLKDLGIKDDNILGIKLEKSDSNCVIRLIQKDGIRYDIILFGADIDTIENEINMIKKTEMFIAVLSLGKLMRDDYLISVHLAHMLCMRSLVNQMDERDIVYKTNFHRYGYKEDLDYYNTYINLNNKYCNSDNGTYNHISKLLISGVENLKNISDEDKNIFYQIWDFYLS